MLFDEDRNGFYPNGSANYPRKNKRFTGPLLDGIPIIGLLTYDNLWGDREYTELGGYNKLL